MTLNRSKGARGLRCARWRTPQRGDWVGAETIPGYRQSRWLKCWHPRGGWMGWWRGMMQTACCCGVGTSSPEGIAALAGKSKGSHKWVRTSMQLGGLCRCCAVSKAISPLPAPSLLHSSTSFQLRRAERRGPTVVRPQPVHMAHQLLRGCNHRLQQTLPQPAV